MKAIRVLRPYEDERGNQIVYAGRPVEKEVNVRFGGRHNRLVVAAGADIVHLGVQFVGDGGTVEILPTSSPRTGLRFGLRVGHDSTIRIGENVGSQGNTMVSAVEGADVVIGEDCMLSRQIEIRCDDSHPIYDVRTGRRHNVSESITIGDHVWIGKEATIMGGVDVGSGSVIGYRSVVTSSVPNNCIVVGVPARVVRTDIAWERPMVAGRRPDECRPRPGEKTERYWNLTHKD